MPSPIGVRPKMPEPLRLRYADLCSWDQTDQRIGGIVLGHFCWGTSGPPPNPPPPPRALIVQKKGSNKRT